MTRTVTILIAVGVLVLTGCETTTPPVPTQQTVIEQGPKAQLLEQIDRRYENPEAHYQLGKLYYAEGARDKADFEYRVALSFDPVHYRAQAGVVKIMVDRQQTDNARAVAELYISQAAVSAQSSIRLGKAFQNEGLGDFAVSCYYQAAGLDPESAEPYKLLGFYYLDKGDKVRAEENLRRSFELNPYQSDVSGELGRMGVIVGLPRKTDVAPPVEPSQEPAESP